MIDGQRHDQAAQIVEAEHAMPACGFERSGRATLRRHNARRMTSDDRRRKYAVGVHPWIVAR